MVCSNCYKKGEHTTTVKIDGTIYYLCDKCAFYIYDILKNALLIPINGTVCFYFVEGP